MEQLHVMLRSISQNRWFRYAFAPQPGVSGVLFALGVVTIVVGLIGITQNAFADVADSPTVVPDSQSAHTETPLLLATPGHQKILALLQAIADRTPEENIYIGDAFAVWMRRQLAALPPDASNQIRWRLHMQLGEAELRLGNEAEAIDHFTQARQLARSNPKVPGSVANQTIFHLGVAHMRHGETQNCCLRHTPESCILPLQGGGIHTQQDGSQQAVAYFTEVLQNTTEQDEVYWEARWLLNIAYMTIGGYPGQVPSSYLIPPKAFKSEEEMPRFTNIAPQLRLDTFDLSGGAIADDFDNDGYLDIVVSTSDPRGQFRFFRNNQDGTFSERTQEAGLLGLYGGLNLVQADYDNDGNVDILVLRGAWLEQYGQHPNSLLRNNGGGTFTDVTFDAGLGKVHYPTQTASWGDYDNDGDLDLYIGNESSEALKAPCQLFRNNGDGTFTDVAAEAGVQSYRFTKAVIWGDYNDDRLPDLYVSNYKGSGFKGANLRGINRLYRNNGDGTFTDVAGQLNVARPMHSFPAWFWDVDNDGALDLYVSSYYTRIGQIAANLLDKPVRMELACLYRGNGDGGFEEVAQRYNLGRPTAPMGANFGDLDNDGYPDFYLGTGFFEYKSLMPNVMYRNQDGSRFADVTYAGGFGHLQKGHGIVFADFDNDGDQDIFEQMGGAFPGDRYSNVLYENPGFGNHWIAIKLVGVCSNQSAIGVRIHAEVIENGVPRSIYKHVNSGGTFGANPLRQTIGLGKATRIAGLEIFWPTTGLTQTFHNVAVNQFIRIVEGEAQYTTIEIKRLKLGGTGVEHFNPYERG